MNFLRTQSIRRQVAFSTVLLLLPIVLAAAWSSIRTRRERADEVRQQAMSIAASSAASVDLYLNGLDSLAAVLVRHPAVVAGERLECERLLADVLRGQPPILDVVLRAADGGFRCSGLPRRDPPQPLAVPHVRQVIESGQPVVSGLTIGAVTRQPTVVLAYPVRGADGASVGVLDFGIDLLQLQTLFAAIPLPGQSIIALTDRLGLVLARSRDADRYLGTTMDVQTPSEAGAEPRTSVKADVDGVERVFASAIVRRGLWTLSVGIPTDVIAARLWPLWRRNLAISLVALLSSLLLSFWIVRHLSRRLDHLRAAAQRIADGDLSPIEPAVSLNREMALLQATFSTMAENLRQAREALDRQAEQERNTRATLETLQRQAVRQERLAAVGLLVSGVAHEMNNPLQAIMGASELLERRHELSGDAMEEVELIKTQSHRASEIIRNLSRFSAQRCGESEIVDIRDVVSEVLQLRRIEIDAAKIVCEVELPSPVKVHATFTEIEQVVLNFIINAQQVIQSTRSSDGRIVIRSSEVGSSVRLEVIDNGPGVPAGDEAKLFQPFFTTKPVGEGTGLGLSVSYGIIDSYGGTIGYQNNELGGSTFYFELPNAEV